ncbi:Heparan sulfate glucosamine 3-O-sulfotransferase 3B1 [Armadillidium vulgare]|nr:Heparan sulfate glucosamine 3-O-sulfotransferase 3B1 [Armadillidium vulgare]
MMTTSKEEIPWKAISSKDEISYTEIWIFTNSISHVDLYDLSLYSALAKVYKRNAIYYESHFERLGDPFWLNHPRTYNRFREPHFGSHFIGGEYLGGYRTDVDKTEERKKKKKREKYKKELKEKCRIDKKACEELKYLLDPKISFTDIDRESFFKSENDSQDLNGPSKPDWNSYADKGFAIVGKQGTLLRRLPHVLIIGAKKAGTRALLEFLRLHPSIAAAGAELHFFDRFFYKGPSWYRSRLPMSLEGQLTVEKTPAYFVDKDVPERVKKVLPTVRLLLVVRDPVIRAISDYTQSMRLVTIFYPINHSK